MLIFLFILYILLSSSGVVLFKLGTHADALFTIFNISLSWQMLLGMTFYVGSFLLWLYLLTKLNLTIAMPISVAFVNTLVVIESCVLLKEKITLVQGIGIFVVIFGVCLITYGAKNA